MRQALFLTLLAGGIAFLLAGLLITRQTWRADIPPYNRRSRFFQIALHPERFARSERLPLIRSLNLLGALLVLCAVATVAHDIFVTTRRG